ncbi:hypothetical protein V9L05_19530 [Bernardetia sp. Wsw4-3y2]|uniref:hypothetical protein n=1 Tax=Bernardetia sp. Wsw4-3y2 TaxID=3127471 RepID=UPI0030D2870D
MIDDEKVKLKNQIMSYEIILISDEEKIDFCKYYPQLRLDEEQNFYISTRNKFLNIFAADAKIEDFYSKEELTAVKSILNKTYYYLIDSNSFELVKVFFGSIPENLNFIIDNDHGGLMRRERILKLKSFHEFIAIEENEISAS